MVLQQPKNAFRHESLLKVRGADSATRAPQLASAVEAG